MTLIDPVFRILPNKLDGVRRSKDRLGEQYLELLHEPGSFVVSGRDHNFGIVPPISLPHEPGAFSLRGENHNLAVGALLQHDVGSFAWNGSNHDIIVNPGAINIGDLSQDAVTPEQIALYLPTTGAVDQAATATVEYKLTSSGIYLPASPMWRIQPQFTDGAPASLVDAFASTIFDLAPGSSYDIRVTVTEPGVGTEVKTATYSTRSLPAAAGTITATPTDETELIAAIAAASPGDVIEFSGTIAMTARLDIHNVSGTEANPIYLRGDDRDTAILDFPGSCLRPRTADWWVIENCTLRGPAVDTGPSASNQAVAFFSDSGEPNNQDGWTFRNLRIDGVDMGIYNENRPINNCLIYDCIIEGNNTWADVVDNSNSWNDDGIRIGGVGNCAWNNEISDFGDAISYRKGTPSVNFSVNACFFWRNNINRSGDDAVEAEYCQRNCAVYDNYTRNTMTGVSIDGIFGGPYYHFRNRHINTGRTIIKNGDDATGTLFYSNTFVCTEAQIPANWYWSSSARVRDWEYRNNLFIADGTSQELFWDEAGSSDPAVISNNGWGRNGQDMVSQGDRGNVAALNAARSPLFDNDIEITNQAAVFSTPVVFGADYHTEITVEYDLTLQPSAQGIGGAVSIPNISGSDMGAIDEGATPPVVGNRYTNTPTALELAAAAVSSGQRVDFAAGVMPADQESPTDSGEGGSGTMFQWGPRFMYGDKFAGLANKRNGSSASTFAFEYDEVASTWARSFKGYLGDSGHQYDGYTLDPTSNIPYWRRWNANAVQQWNGSTFVTQSISPTIDSLDDGSSRTVNPIEFHPNLFGAGEHGIVYAAELVILAFKISDWSAVQASVHANVGTATACYSPFYDATYVAGSSDGLIRKVTANGAIPTVQVIGTTPQSVGAGNADAAIWALGDKLYCIGDSVYYVSSDEGATWGSSIAQPFDYSGETAASQHLIASIEQYGIFWMIGSGGLSQIWKP